VTNIHRKGTLYTPRVSTATDYFSKFPNPIVCCQNGLKNTIILFSSLFN